MKWTKLGKVFCASGQNEWMVSDARAPVPLHLRDDVYRIYFASCDASVRGRIFSLDLDLHNPQGFFNLVTSPVVDIGAMGFFDDNGVSPSDVLRVDTTIWLYTIGFSVKNRLLFDAAVGLATSRDGGATFQKLKGPILDRSVDDPCFSTSPTVLHGKDGWRMWYVSGDRWEPKDGGHQHFYNIKHRRSQDGVHWGHDPDVCIDYANKHEYAISRPSVLRDREGKYRMWYSFRAQPGVATNRIGYAESDDGVRWVRMDNKAGIDVSPDGWDSEMICYPRVFEHKDRLYMLYNGNHYGRTGFGLAVLEENE